MCRSIKRLREGNQVADDDEVRAAALQFVRKVSGFREPTTRHREAFEAAVDDISDSVRVLMDSVAQGLAR